MNKDKKIKVCPETGLLIESEQDAKESIEVIEGKQKRLKALKQAIKDDHGLNKEKKVKNNSDYFYRLYKNKYQLFIDLSPTTCKLFLFLLYNMDHMDNVVVVDNKHPTHKDIIKLSGISDKSVLKGLKELKERNIIVVNNKGRYREIIFNPSIIEDSMTSEAIYKMFKGKK